MLPAISAMSTSLTASAEAVAASKRANAAFSLAFSLPNRSISHVATKFPEYELPELPEANVEGGTLAKLVRVIFRFGVVKIAV